MSAEKNRETPELNQIVKLGIRTGLFLFCPGKLTDVRIDRINVPIQLTSISLLQSVFSLPP